MPLRGCPVEARVPALRDAPLDASVAPCPIIMFSHGSCPAPTQSLFVQPLLTSHGLIVVAPPHPGNRLTDGLEVCGAPATLATSAQERPQDVIHVLDEMLAATRDADSSFVGAIDDTWSGMMGHSFGGFTTSLVTDLDPRIVAVVPLAPAANGVPSLAVPSLTMVGNRDTVVDDGGTRDRFDASVSSKSRHDVEHGGHYVFSDLCFPGSDCDPPTTRTQPGAHAVALRWILPFLEVHIAGEQAFAPCRAEPQPAGVTVEFVS